MEENLEQLVEKGESLDIEPIETGSKIGKFKDVNALLTAYNNLQSEYTKKCQAYSSLQKSLKDNSESFDLGKKASTPETETKVEKDNLSNDDLSIEDREKLLQDYILNNPSLRDKLIAHYFDELILPKAPKLIGSDRGSNAMVSPVSKPKTLEDAERVVRDMFNKNKG